MKRKKTLLITFRKREDRTEENYARLANLIRRSNWWGCPVWGVFDSALFHVKEPFRLTGKVDALEPREKLILWTGTMGEREVFCLDDYAVSPEEMRFLEKVVAPRCYSSGAEKRRIDWDTDADRLRYLEKSQIRLSEKYVPLNDEDKSYVVFTLSQGPLRRERITDLLKITLPCLTERMTDSEKAKARELIEARSREALHGYPQMKEFLGYIFSYALDELRPEVDYEKDQFTMGLKFIVPRDRRKNEVMVFCHDGDFDPWVDVVQLATGTIPIRLPKVG